jgi:hypothetical protein
LRRAAAYSSRSISHEPIPSSRIVPKTPGRRADWFRAVGQVLEEKKRLESNVLENEVARL